ncbi:MAG: tryptophan synthase subunit alpha [Lachnospira sp.]
MNRIESRMEALKKENKKAFITYMTAGLPDLNKTKELIHVQESSGIDVIEVGIPFSDPVADGPIIQNASYKSILNGTNLTGILEMMKEVRKEGSNVPIVFMMYYNTVYHFGLERFAKECADAGVDGLIIPDLPFEEQGELQQVLASTENAPIIIQLVSPVSKQRIPMILENARGFVYCVSQMGVTGKGANFHEHIREYLSDVKSKSTIPVMMGFGIRTAADVKPLVDVIDGAIVGSHFINLLTESNYNPETVAEYVSTFKKELND